MRKIIDTKHSIDRFIERHSEFSKKRVNKVILDAMDQIITKYKDESTTYGIWSKSTGICVIVDWRKDTKNKEDKNNHAIIITLPPIKKDFKDFHTTNKKDIRLIVESYLNTMIQKRVLKEDKDINKLKRIYINGLSVFLHEGFMYDSGIAFCLQVY